MIGPRASKQTRTDEIDARELVNLRDHGVCVRCLRTHPIFGVNFDHRKNRSQGGLWSASNGQLMCGSGTVGCHGFVTANPAAALAGGWAVPGSKDPAEWPARRWFPTPIGTLRLGWCLYKNDGRIVRITDEEAARLMGGAF